MPERPLTIATYAVGASLCAISLFYVFGPGFPFDEDVSSSTKRRIVGLQNPHNLCFCNSVLQALANSPGLRKYLIRETHRRSLDGPDVYKVDEQDVPGQGREAAVKRWKLEKLQEGLVTHALKAMLDRLNERPLHRKTISAAEFLRALENAFQTRISTDQQDAQEFLQIVLERLCDEFHAGKKARRKHQERQSLNALTSASLLDVEKSKELAPSIISTETTKPESQEASTEIIDVEDEFPFEGQTESEIECRFCGFIPKPAVSTFVTLTLNVPHTSTTTLNQCFDGVFKQEIIEGFRCDKCRLAYAKEKKEQQLLKATDEKQAAKLQTELEIIDDALENDPERELKEANLPEDAPKRTIRKAVRISRFPKVLAVHLSRSLYSATSLSTKNTAKVTFPDGLQVGGLLSPHNYRLTSVITHKGGHNSGHYETFRRQYNYMPIATPSSFGTHGVYSRHSSPSPSTPQLRPSSSISQRRIKDVVKDVTSPPSRPAPLTPEKTPAISLSPPAFLEPPLPTESTQSTPRSSMSLSPPGQLSTPSRPTSSATARDSVFIAPTVFSEKAVSTVSLAPPPGANAAEAAKLQKRQRKQISRWWRVSDEKVRESKTSDVLSMQKEVYLLFYEAEN